MNGISEISVTRLKHLREVSFGPIGKKRLLILGKALSAKWIDRFERIRSAFEAEGSFKNYRRLSKVAPCIPFLGKKGCIAWLYLTERFRGISERFSVRSRWQSQSGGWFLQLSQVENDL